MEIVKKNLVSIICGVVALVAIVAAFYPMSGYFDELRAQAEKRVKQYNAFDRLWGKHDREWPRVVEGQQVALQAFPFNVIKAKGEGIRNKLRTESQSVLNYVVDINRNGPTSAPNRRGHNLLVAGCLPAPTQATAYDFRRAFGPALLELKERTLQAGAPPREADILAREKEIWEKEIKPGLISDGQGKFLNQAEKDAEFARRKVGVPRQLVAEIINSKKLYLDENVIVGSKAILETTQQPTAAEIWYAQMALWIQQDVCQIIADTNGGKPIGQAPVKRLIALTIPSDMNMYVSRNIGDTLRPGGDRPGADRDNAASQDPSAADFQLSCTGRQCNSLYDVVRFQFTVHMEAKKLQQLLKRLVEERFIVPLKVDISAIDYNALLSQGYEYGPMAVVEVKLECEQLFLREWTAPIMPTDVRKLLGVPDDWKSMASELKAAE